jgi:hypothetical protein
MSLTGKHKGDAGEMLVVAELTLAGIPAIKMPDNWPHYDVIAQRKKGKPERISVKTRAWKVGSQFLGYLNEYDFDWLAAVILMPSEEKEYQREFYLIPRDVFEDRAKRARAGAKQDIWRCKIDRVHALFPEYKDNFGLSLTGGVVE